MCTSECTVNSLKKKYSLYAFLYNALLWMILWNLFFFILELYLLEPYFYYKLWDTFEKFLIISYYLMSWGVIFKFFKPDLYMFKNALMKHVSLNVVFICTYGFLLLKCYNVTFWPYMHVRKAVPSANIMHVYKWYQNITISIKFWFSIKKLFYFWRTLFYFFNELCEFLLKIIFKMWKPYSSTFIQDTKKWHINSTY